MFKSILIPTDGSEFSEKVVKDGMALAKALAATVTALHVVPSSFAVTYGFYGEVPWVDDELHRRMRDAAKAEGKKYLDRIQAAAHAAGVKCERVLVETNVIWKGIVDAAHERDCDLIMMAAHGRRGLAAMVLGSETNRVLTHSKIPVLVYR